MRWPARDSPRFVVGVVSVGHFLSHVYQLSLPPLFPLLARDLALSNTQLGLLVAVIYVMMLLQTPVGSVVDTIGAKRVFVFGLVVTSGGIVLAGLSAFSAGVAPVYWVLLGAMVVSGLGQATFHPADYPLLDVVSDHTNRGKHFSVHMFAGFLGFATAPIVVGGLGLAFNWSLALVAVGAVGLVYALIANQLLEELYRGNLDDAEDTPAPTAGTDTPGVLDEFKVLLAPAIVLLLLFYFGVSVASLGINSFTVMFVVEGFAFTEAVGNLSLSMFMILASAGILVGGALADRFNVRALIMGMLLLASASLAFILIGPVPSSTLLVALFGLVGFWYGLTIPARDSLISLLSPKDALGKTFGFVTTGISFGGLSSPVIVGYLIDRFDPFVGFSFIAVMFLLSALLVLAMRR